MKKYWWVSLIFLVFVFIFWKFGKKKEKIEYYNQSKINKKRSIEELEWNPTKIKHLKHLNKYYKVYGQIHAIYKKQIEPEIKQQIWKEYSQTEIRQFKIEAIKKTVKGEKVPSIEAFRFSVRRKYFNFVLFKLYYGEKEVLFIECQDITQTKIKELRIHEYVNLIWRDNFITPLKSEWIEIVSDMQERLMTDNKVNAMGQQQKDFSRIRTDYAHNIDKMDKEINYEKEKEKGRRHG